MHARASTEESVVGVGGASDRESGAHVARNERTSACADVAMTTVLSGPRVCVGLPRFLRQAVTFPFHSRRTGNGLVEFKVSNHARNVEEVVR